MCAIFWEIDYRDLMNIRKIAIIALGLVLIAGTYVLAHTFHIEPLWFELVKNEITLPCVKKPATPLKILFISDIHAGDDMPFSEIERAFDIGLKQKPDLILFGGDFITNIIPDMEIYGKLLQKLSSKAPSFACMGNHDGGKDAILFGGPPDCTEIRKLLRNSGITPLENQSSDITVNDRKLRIIGLGDLWAGNMRPDNVFNGEAAVDDVTVIVLAHNPDSKEDLVKYKWDLMLCGHTHGGQCAMPFLGPPVLPVSDRTFSAGLYEWCGRKIYVSRGIGNIWGVRFNCRPEITLITLK